MAGTITWEQLRELAAFRAQHGCAVSLYIGLDPSIVPTAGRSRLAHAVAARACRAAARRAARELSHDERKALKRDLERIEGWFETTSAARASAASRCSRPSSTISSCRFRCRGRSRTRRGSRSSSTSRRSSASSGAATARSSRTSDASAATSIGSATARWSRSRTRLRTSPAVTTRAAGRRRATSGTSRRSSTGTCGTSPTRSIAAFEGSATFASCSPARRRRAPTSKPCSRPRCARALVGWVAAEAHADAPRLLEAARPLLDDWRAGREEELLERWREEAARNGRAATGWEETLQAASDGRVELLLVQEGADQPGVRLSRVRARTDGGRELPARRNDAADRRNRPRSRRPPDAHARRHGRGHRRGASRPRAGRRPRCAAQVLEVLGSVGCRVARGELRRGDRSRRSLDASELRELAAGETPWSRNFRALGRTRVSSEPTVSL